MTTDWKNFNYPFVKDSSQIHLMRFIGVSYEI